MATRLKEPVTLDYEERLSLKVVAVGGRVGDWAAYVGPEDWPEDKVAERGNKLPKRVATDIFRALDEDKYRE